MYSFSLLFSPLFFLIFISTYCSLLFLRCKLIICSHIVLWIDLVAYGCMQSCLSGYLHATCACMLTDVPFLSFCLFLFPWFFFYTNFFPIHFLVFICNAPVDISFSFHFVCCLFFILSNIFIHYSLFSFFL